MTRVIVFLFIFSNICFAQDTTCKDLGKNIQELNDLQNKALNIDNSIEQINILESSIAFIAQMKNIKSDDDLTKALSKYTLKDTSEDDMKIFSYLYEEGCSENKSITSKELIEKRFLSCISNVKQLIKEENRLTFKENTLKNTVAGLKNIIKISFENPKVINLGIVKKSLAQKFLDQKCTEGSSNKELSESQAFNYACRDIVHRPHTEGRIEDFSKDNLDILLELELQNNKVAAADLKKSCDELLKDPELKEVLSSCSIGKVGAAVVSQIGKKDPPKGGPTKPQTVPVDKTKGEFKNKGDRNPASKNKIVKKKVDPDSYKAKRARKRKRTWKTIGIVTAAVGATGLAVWGLSELFKPTPSTLEFTPHPNSLKPYHTQSYDMNTYQQYIMYQNYQSNQSMMYQNNLYQGSTYGYGNNWIGAQDSSASSPYTFEYGF
jgi:hypothetical protein